MRVVIVDHQAGEPIAVVDVPMSGEWRSPRDSSGRVFEFAIQYTDLPVAMFDDAADRTVPFERGRMSIVMVHYHGLEMYMAISENEQTAEFIRCAFLPEQTREVNKAIFFRNLASVLA